MTISYMKQHCQHMRLTANATDRLLHFVKDIPTITSNAANYANMLHYCLNNEVIKLSDICIWHEPSTNTADLAWGDSRWHGTWISEQRLFNSIKEGRIEDQGNMNTGNIGKIGGGDPLRQAKNELIVFAAICCRASIFGGVSPKGAYNLSDYFIQLIEDADTISSVRNISPEMQQAFVERVRRAKKNSAHTALVRSCTEYIETHLCEKIVLKNLAQDIGYNEYYVSRAFKKETGESLTDYINRRKIGLAKVILKNSNLSISEISERLAFSSSSYFITIFKKYVGVSPVEYRNQDL